ncbi:MAG: thymidine phosphorylase [Clostridia bacterium]|nr:thymidine phosphorylase [Clostridia bacterium]
MYDIITKKREGEKLSREEIAFFIKGFTSGEIPDYQAAALLMAICIRGMTDEETVALTEEMATSGDTVDLSCLKNTVDKHSTGGVGDKVSLVVAPLVASLGATVAKMSGRGLGHTGGTIDKLESIPGFKTEISSDEFFEIAKKHGVVIVGQSGNLDPADKKLYALRDVTATVPAMPLIASSIMSKKLAAGAHSIVLDVTVGSGSFMPEFDMARELAEKMVKIGKAAGRNIAAVITDMDAPLGVCVGNSLEVGEAVEILKGKGTQDLRQVCVTIGAEMLSLALGEEISVCREKCERALDDGTAYDRFKKMVAAQGGDTSFIDDASKFPRAKNIISVYAESDGFIYHMNTSKIGEISVVAGAGREKKGDKIDFSAGIEVLKKTGDSVKKGDVIARIHTNKTGIDGVLTSEYLSAVELSDKAPQKRPHIWEIVR